MKKFVAAIDFSAQAQLVVAKAVELAKATGAALEVVHLVAPEPDFVGYTLYAYPGRDERADELRHEKEQLRAIVDRLKEEGTEVAAFMKEAPTADGIIEFAEHHDADLIVIGSHSKGLLRRVFVGSIAHSVISRSPVPVLVVPPSDSDS